MSWPLIIALALVALLVGWRVALRLPVALAVLLGLAALPLAAAVWGLSGSGRDIAVAATITILVEIGLLAGWTHRLLRKWRHGWL